MKLNYFMLAAAMTTCLGASAQFTNGGGSSASGDYASSYNRFQISYVNESISPSHGDSQSTNGVGLKWLHGFQLTQERPLYLQSGLDLHVGFWSDSYEEEDYDYKYEQKLTTMNLAVPVSVAYQFAVGENVIIEPFVGLNIKFNALAKMKETYDDDDESESISMFDKDLDKDYRWKRFQLGWHVGGNVMLQNKYYLSLQYGTDFMSICKKTNTSTFSVGLGLNF